MEREVICNACGSRDRFIYFAGDGAPSRICVTCLNRQVGFEIIVQLSQSDDPPVDAIAYCNGCGQELTGDYGDVGWIPMDEEDEL